MEGGISGVGERERGVRVVAGGVEIAGGGDVMFDKGGEEKYEACQVSWIGGSNERIDITCVTRK